MFFNTIGTKASCYYQIAHLTLTTCFAESDTPMRASQNRIIFNLLATYSRRSFVWKTSNILLINSRWRLSKGFEKFP